MQDRKPMGYSSFLFFKVNGTSGSTRFCTFCRRATRLSKGVVSATTTVLILL